VSECAFAGFPGGIWQMVTLLVPTPTANTGALVIKLLVAKNPIARIADIANACLGIFMKTISKHNIQRSCY